MYNKLSNHLTQKLNENIDIKNTSLVLESESNKKSWWAIAGSFFTNFFNPDKKKDEKDPITAELMRQEQDAEASAKKREEDLLKAKESAEAAKLAAKYEARKNKASLANQRKIDVWNAKKRKAQEATKYWSSNKTERSEAEILAWEKQMDDAWSSLGDSGYDSDQEKYKDLLYVVAFKEDGTPRTEQEIIDLKSKSESDLTPEEKELLGHVNELTKMTKEKGGEIAAAIKDSGEGFTKVLEQIQTDTTKKSAAEQDLEDTKKIQEEYNKRASVVEKFKDIASKSSEDDEELKAAEDEVHKFENPDEDAPLSFSDGKPVIRSGEGNIAKYVEELCNNDEKIKGASGEEKARLIANKLKDAGFPEDIVDGAMPGDFQSNDTEFVSHFAKEIGKAAEDSDKLSSMEESINSKLESNYAKAKQRKENAEASKDKDSFDPKNPTSIEEYKKAHPEDAEDLDLYLSIDEEEIKAGTYTNPDEKKKCDEAVKAAQKTVDDINTEEKQRKTQVKERRAKLNANSFNENLPDEIKDKVKSLRDELKPGEEYIEHDGKVVIGYIDENGKPHPKPDINKDSAEKNDEYEKGKNRAILLKPIKKNNSARMTKISDSADDDGKYEVTFSDGTTKKLTASEVASEKANNEAAEENIAIAEDRKGKAADLFKKCLNKDGEIDEEKVKALKPEDKAIFNSIVKSAKDGKLDDMFDGLDLGNSSLEAIKHATTDFDDVYSKRDKSKDGSEDDEWEDIEDNDSEDDEERESDETENYTDENGEEKTRKKVLKNPAKEYKRKKRKNGKGMTKSYYNKKGDSISSDEYKERMERYKSAKRKDESVKYSNLRNYLFEKINK